MAATVATELTETSVFMNLKAFKKRRGRPPKYLDIWRQEYLMKMAAENKVDPKGPGTQNDEKSLNAASGSKEEKLEKEENKTLTVERRSENKKNGDIDEAELGRPRSDEMMRFVKSSDEISRPRSAENSLISAGNEEMPQLELRRTKTGILERESLLGIPSTKLMRRRASSDSTQVRRNSDAYQDILDRESKELNEMSNHESSDLPLSPSKAGDELPSPTLIDRVEDDSNIHLRLQSNIEQPMKRKPGRPPGSTKKFKGQLGEDTKRDQTTGVSLRQFFEAGGRDYNEYLEWLQKKQIKPNLSSAIQNGKGAFPHALPGQAALQQIGGFPGQHLPGHRGPTLLNPRSPLVAVNPPGFLPSRPLPGPHNPAPMPGDLIHCHPLAGYHSPIIVHVASSPEHSSTQDMEYEALDLSAKKRRTQSPLPDTGVGRSDGESSGGSSPGSEGPGCGGTNDLSGWDVDQVVKFVSEVPGCQEYAEVFREHMIDGSTLPHLSEDHLLKFVSMKLGPAIRLKMAVADRIKEHLNR